MGDETRRKHPKLREIFGELSEREGIILRGDRILVPGELRGDVLDASHEGCPGREAMTRQLRGSVWWSGMETDIQQITESCLRCLASLGRNSVPPMVERQNPEGCGQNVRWILRA